MGRPKNYEPKTIYARLREEYNECHEKRLSQEELGKALGLSKSAVSRIENGDTIPSLDIQKRYCEFFGISIAELLGTADNTDLNTVTAGALGLSSEAVETLRLLSEHSDKSQNLMALVNAFLGCKENTLLFFQNLFFFIKEKANLEETEKYSDFREMPLWRTTGYLEKYTEYIECIIPQMRRAIKNAQYIDELIINLPDEIKYADADTPD